MSVKDEKYLSYRKNILMSAFVEIIKLKVSCTKHYNHVPILMQNTFVDECTNG